MFQSLAGETDLSQLCAMLFELGPFAPPSLLQLGNAFLSLYVCYGLSVVFCLLRPVCHVLSVGLCLLMLPFVSQFACTSCLS